ncbi:UNVERIFIED_CONTAM: hypothetical protein K2H54_055698 [Gekko kuhli]
MADTTDPPDHQDSPSSKRDIQELKDDLQTFFRTSMSELLHPVNAKLEELTEGLGAAGRAAESALEMVEKVQNEVAALKRSEAILQTKIGNLENRWRQMNLKLRGMSEGAEQGSVDTEETASSHSGRQEAAPEATSESPSVDGHTRHLDVLEQAMMRLRREFQGLRLTVAVEAQAKETDSEESVEGAGIEEE